MPIETRIQLLLIGTSFFTIAINVGSLVFAHYSEALGRTLSQERPMARAAIKGVISLVVATTIGLVLLTVSLFYRNYYALPIVLDASPNIMTPVVVMQTIVYYTASVWSGTLLWYLAWSVRETDEKVKELRLKRYKEAARRVRRGGENARNN